MKAFADLFTALDETTKTTEKVRALVDYFGRVTAADAAWATYFLIGRKPRQVIPMPKLRAWAIEEAGIPDWLFQESYDAVGDIAETIALLLPPLSRAGGGWRRPARGYRHRRRDPPVQGRQDSALRDAAKAHWPQGRHAVDPGPGSGHHHGLRPDRTRWRRHPLVAAGPTLGGPCRADRGAAARVADARPAAAALSPGRCGLMGRTGSRADHQPRAGSGGPDDQAAGRGLWRRPAPGRLVEVESAAQHNRRRAPARPTRQRQASQPLHRLHVRRLGPRHRLARAHRQGLLGADRRGNPPRRCLRPTQHDREVRPGAHRQARARIRAGLRGFEPVEPSQVRRRRSVSPYPSLAD